MDPTVPAIISQSCDHNVKLTKKEKPLNLSYLSAYQQVTNLNKDKSHRVLNIILKNKHGQAGFVTTVSTGDTVCVTCRACVVKLIKSYFLNFFSWLFVFVFVFLCFLRCNVLSFLGHHSFNISIGIYLSDIKQKVSKPCICIWNCCTL